MSLRCADQRNGPVADIQQNERGPPTEAALFEPDAHALFSLPNDATRLFELVAEDKQCETVGDVERGDYFKLSARF